MQFLGLIGLLSLHRKCAPFNDISYSHASLKPQSHCYYKSVILKIPSLIYVLVYIFINFSNT